jgi:hypothetical protein
MTSKLRGIRRPPRPDNIGKTRLIKSIDGQKRRFLVKDEVVVPYRDRKLIYFQQLRFEKRRQFEYRLTYYMLSTKPSRRNRWVFGQYSLMVPARELGRLIREARKRGWPGI